VLEMKQDKEEIKVGPCPYHKSNKSHHCLAVLENCSIKEDIYLHNDCGENTAECVLLHESIHAILYHFLDEEKFRRLLPQLIEDKVDLNRYLKEELISSKYDNQSKLCFPCENWFSSLQENWNSENWFCVNDLMKIKWKK
jgi:hypothetical protein